MINLIFNKTVDVLNVIANITKSTYKEINFVIFLVIIPYSWCFLVDMIFKTYRLELAFITLLLSFIIIKRKKTSVNEAFNMCRDMLNYLNKFGINYYTSSVIICLIIPVIIYVLLIIQI